ncbi:phage minor head protein [Streptococcus lutetiensis]|uniref:phage minor head protein n=1 Tax=Streptococcus lutetiensis TaxID=150055 RepID=UPI001BD9D25D|nr:phage minor head protein [Streptococcus lutetiensis]MBT0946207.1 phage head morphogenesis protein [Streptococcus lutetiensis]
MTKLNQFQQEIENLLAKADKKTDKQLYGLYIDTIKDLKKALLVDYQRYEQLSSTEKLKLSRMTNLLEQLDKSTKELKQGLKTEINGHLEDTGKIAYNELFYEYESKNTAINFTMLKSEELKKIIETPVANYKLSERLNDGVAERLKSNIKSELTRVFLLGYSYKQTAARLAELGYSSYRRALNITRTEAGRVQAIARQKSQMEAMKLGVEFEKEWISTLDNRTRSDHAKLDGQRVKPDEDFEVSGLKAKQPHMFGVAAEDCNCRCRTISRLKNDKSALLRRDNETGKVGRWKNYHDWASSKGFEVPKRLPKMQIDNYRKGAIRAIEKTNMSSAVGLANYNQFLDKFDTIKDENMLKMYSQLGNKLEFQSLKRKRAFARRSSVQLNQDCFDGIKTKDGQAYIKNPLSTVFHENGHAFDYLGFDKLTKGERVVIGQQKSRLSGKTYTVDIYGTHASSLPQYNLKETLQNDFWRYINGDLRIIKKGERVPAAERAEIRRKNQENIKEFVKEVEKLGKKVPDVIPPLSDMFEATGYHYDYPFGWGHGKKYWKRPGSAETEFFAEISELLATSPEAYNEIKRMLPNAVEVYHRIVEDILKEL